MEIPDKISQAFMQAFPDADSSNIDWQWSVPGKIYEATFQKGGQLIEAEFTITGSHLCTDRHINREDLPEATLMTINERFEEFDLVHLDEVTFSDGTVLYEAGFVTSIEEEQEDEESQEGEEDDYDAEESGLTAHPETNEDILNEEASGTYFEVLINAQGLLMINDDEEEESEEQ